jgi:hypothetical protein
VNLDPDKKYKVIQGIRNYYGTPEIIIKEMSSWDRSRPDGDPSQVSNNTEYIQIVLERLFIEENIINEINDECKLLSFLEGENLLEIS